MARKAAEKTAKLADVAEAAGVSRGTVSNVFNRPQLVRPEVRDRVLGVAREIGYRGADPKGRLLRAGKVNAIGVATAQPLSYFFSDPFARELMAGISEVCSAAGAGISLVSAASEERLDWNVRSAVVDGFILFCMDDAARLIALTRERQLPYVTLQLGHDDQSAPAVGIDNFAGARMAARHLAALGHRRVAVLGMPFRDHAEPGLVGMAAIDDAAYSTTRDRTHGYFAGLREFGILVNGVPVFDTQNDDGAIEGALSALFAIPNPPTALLAMSDRIALTALKWLRAHGKTVPRDVSVVGFDGIAEGERSTPPLTTIAQPMAELGRRAALAILSPPEGLVREQLDVTLLVRSSSGPPPVR